MKKLSFVVLTMVLLCGCSQPKTFETMSDVYYEPEAEKAGTITFSIPADAAVTVMENAEHGVLYLCDEYCIVQQILPSGDLDATVRSVTGYPKKNVKIMQREVGESILYSCVWASAGENGDQVGKAVILDDGGYHYVLSVMADADIAGKLADQWRNILDTFSIVP